MTHIVSLNIFKSAVLIKLTSKVTSRVRFEINFPVCTPSINFVSVEINDFIIFVRWKSLYLLPNDIYIINNIDLVIICELQTTYPLQST